MNKTGTVFIITLLCMVLAGPAAAHFGMLIPNNHIITQDHRATTLTLSFSHPFEAIGMDLVRPEKFTVTRDGQTVDLLPTLEATEVMGHKAWRAAYAFPRPGIYQFVMEPKPYWEPAEDLSIIHYTKTIVPAYGDDVGWDAPVGLPTEIVPLLRPFGNYVGNSFVGRVLINGKPVPGAEVEVEYYNQDTSLAAPSDYHITQVILADDQGVFSFSCPRAGWWGFSALSEADYTIKDPDGNDKPVELGAVLWIYMDSFMEAAK